VDTLYTIRFRESGLSSFNNFFLKSDHWLRRYCILSGGVFILSHPVYPDHSVRALWAGISSTYFQILNGVKQGRVSPVLLCR